MASRRIGWDRDLLRWRRHRGLKLTPEERFWLKVDRSGGPDACWPWTGAILRNGYGYFAARHGEAQLAHRWIYKQKVGPIPEGLDLDHDCHNQDGTCPGGKACRHRRCVNYLKHLAPADPADNRRRGRKGGARPKSHCKRGHARTPENVYARSCRICERERQHRRYLAKKAAKT